ncbi:MAG: exosortase K [Lachnospiraceae bacterium]|nr:exosortase K [Lachnospiraceae bacterium]
MKLSNLEFSHTKDIIKNHWIVYGLTIIAALVMRYFCRTNDSDTLTWILTPTTRCVSTLSGISFEYIPHMGYINHFYQFLIAPSCSGSKFMLLTFIMLIFSFLYQIDSTLKGIIWFILSAIFSYASTIFVNSIRIIASIYLPIRLEDLQLIHGFLTQDRLHTIIGSTVYFSGLCLIYILVSFIFRRIVLSTGFSTIIAPAFWYMLIVLALPFLKRLYNNEWDGFAWYAALVALICFSVTMLFRLILIPLFHKPGHEKNV